MGLRMNNRLEHLLSIWHEGQRRFQWILATVIETQGSSYRKPGAMMLINDMSQYFGLISGGCLESDVMTKARKCWDTGHSQVVCYDMREEDDIGWQLGIGCGGMVKILLQPITESNNFLSLEALHQGLLNRQTCYYLQSLDTLFPHNRLLTKQPSFLDDNCIVHTCKPRPAITIFGGGVDAQPVCKIAATLGWHITLVDERVNYARAAYFPDADSIIKKPFNELARSDWLQQIDAAVIMTHNVRLDGLALKLVQNSSAQYVGLLGPKHRAQKVFESARLPAAAMTKTLFNPIGLDIGGELPESIALSILSEAHAVLEGKQSAAQCTSLKDVS